MEAVRWGILGAGTIASKLAEAINEVDEAVLAGIGSRSLEKSQSFAKTHGAEHVFGSYEELCASEHIDIIYIATPHSFHKEHTLLALNHGKHVLCEKPFAVNKEDALEMTSAAKKKNLFLMEAMWSCVMPGLHKLKYLLKSGKIGIPKIVEADFGFQGNSNSESRLLNPALGGGALLDVGVYPLALGMYLFGKPLSYSSSAYLGKTGVDESSSYTLLFENGVLGRFSSSITVETSCSATVYGTEGSIHLPASFWHYGKLQVRNGEEQEFDFSHENSNYVLEVIEACKCINDGLIESPQVPWNWTLDMMELLDGIRQQIGLLYPSESMSS